MKQALFIGLILVAASCNEPQTRNEPVVTDTVAVVSRAQVDRVVNAVKDSGEVNTRNVSAQQVVHYAKTLIGVPYKYASSDPAQGFDCSGFITYVFNHFNIEVPRSSVDFTNVGTPIDRYQSKPGDLILFTGTDSLDTKVGHMGIVTENSDSLRFIHSTSGKKYGVTITALNEYYGKRFVKVIRVF